MNFNRTFFKWAAAAAVAAGALFARLRPLRPLAWSVGVNVPGIAVGVASPGYYPQPAYVAPPRCTTARLPSITRRRRPCITARPVSITVRRPATTTMAGHRYYRHDGHELPLIEPTARPSSKRFACCH